MPEGAGEEVFGSSGGSEATSSFVGILGELEFDVVFLSAEGLSFVSSAFGQEQPKITKIIMTKAKFDVFFILLIEFIGLKTHSMEYRSMRLGQIFCRSRFVI